MTYDPFAPGSARRLEEPEQMDAPDIDPSRLSRALRFIRTVNRAFGYTRALVGHLNRLTVNWPADRPLRVLDVATGSADVPVAVLKWARRRALRLEIIGLDLHAQTLIDARRFSRDRVPLVQGDALALPFDNGAFDIAITSMFLHHLPTELTIDALREMDRVSSAGVIAADLIRDRRAYCWITLFTLLADPMVAHDARVSVKQAFTIAEVEMLAPAAGLKATVTRHFGHRFVMTAPKAGTSGPSPSGRG